MTAASSNTSNSLAAPQPSFHCCHQPSQPPPNTTKLVRSAQAGPQRPRSMSSASLGLQHVTTEQWQHFRRTRNLGSYTNMAVTADDDDKAHKKIHCKQTNIALYPRMIRCNTGYPTSAVCCMHSTGKMGYFELQ